MGKLTTKGVEKLIRDGKPGATADDAGLYLKVKGPGAASWQFRFQLAGARRAMGLGPCASVGLAEARQLAADARKLVAEGIDPLEARNARLARKAAAAGAVPAKARTRPKTFREHAAAYIEAHRASWRNAKHAQQWENTLTTYAYPTIGDKAPNQITTEDMLAILSPIWTTKAETASRVRNRIELVLDAAAALGAMKGPNPARWRGHLDKLLPKRAKASKSHHTAMSYAELPEFFAKLGARSDNSSRALQLLILTAARTSEVLLAKWPEFDFDAGVWNIPGERMKSGRPHRVPLSPHMLDVLNTLPRDESDYLFPGARKGRPLSNMAMLQLMRGMNLEAVPHGFRSTFRDWAAEETHYAREVCEMALAHVIGDQTEAAYRRGDLLEKRRQLMNDWGAYCVSKTNTNVNGPTHG